MSAEYEKNSAEVMFKCGRHCCICRRFRPTMLQVHHIVERNAGGGDELDNLIAVCLTCHSDAHTSRPFARRFTPDELKRHRDRVFEMVANGTLVPPNDDESPLRPIERPPETSVADEAFVITADGGMVQPRLPNEAADILLAAAASRDGIVMTVRHSGGYAVQVGNQNFVPSRSPRDEARFENAISELVCHGLLAGNDQVLRVTHRGFLLADELQAVKERAQRRNAPPSSP